MREGRTRQAGKERPPMQERSLSGIRTQIHDITLGLVYDILLIEISCMTLITIILTACRELEEQVEKLTERLSEANEVKN